MVSNPNEWEVTVEGRHVPTGVEWIPPTKSQKIAEYVKDNIVTIRSYGSKPFDIFRKTKAGIDENNLEKAFEDSKRHPSADRIGTFISNIDKRHSYQSGQWSAVHSIIPELKDKGILLLYQRDNPEAAINEIDHCYVLCLSNKTALSSARTNQHILGIDGKHGLQDDGACLLTSTTQHQSGFGCPTAFTIVNREIKDSILLTLRSIIDNVPCEDLDCRHAYQYFSLPDNKGFRRHTPCSINSPYRPFIMIDKHEPSANACIELGLKYVLCWFHAVKAIMEKLKTFDLSLVNQYILILGFKIVARSVTMEEASHRWGLFIQVIYQN